MERLPRDAVANPSWGDGAEAQAEACYVLDDFVLGYGFSDTAFLFRRSQWARQNYRRVVPASWRYPLAHVGPVFEQRVDSWMRRGRLLRATYLPAQTIHQGAVGTAYPRLSRRQRLRRRWFTVAGRGLARAVPRDPRMVPYGHDDRDLREVVSGPAAG